MGRLLDRNILDEQPQHPFTVLSLCGGSVPYARQILSQRQDFHLLLWGNDTRLLALKFRGLFLEFFRN